MEEEEEEEEEEDLPVLGKACSLALEEKGGSRAYSEAWSG